MQPTVIMSVTLLTTAIEDQIPMRPYDVKDSDEVQTLKRDNFDAGDFWILTDGYDISICEQKSGHAPTQKIHIPRAVFNKIVSWYMREQKPVVTANSNR